MKANRSYSQLTRPCASLIAIAILSVLAGNAHGQWTLQTSGTTQFLRDVEFLNENVGWAVGSNSAVIRTLNAGAGTWTSAGAQIPPVNGGGTFQGYGLHVENAQSVWVVGGNGEMWRTMNSGASWTNPGYSASLAGYLFTDIHFLGVFGCIAGQSNTNTTGVIRYTTNGGSNWHTVLGSAGLSGIQALSSTRAVAVGILGSIYILDISAGIGNEALSPISTGTSNRLYDVHFFDSNNGWAVGENSTVLKTTNGGVSWTNIDFGVLSGLTSLVLTSVHFWDASHGVLVGGDGERWITKDGGASWMDNYNGSEPFYYGVTLTSASSGFVVGESGTIERYAVPDIDVTIGTIPVPDGAALSVGNTAPGTPLEETFTIHNSGAATLNINSLAVISGDTSDFSVGTLSSSSIAVGDSATFQVVFTPTVLGFRSALVHLSTNVAHPKTLYSFELQGNGIGTPRLSVSPLRRFKSTVRRVSRPQRFYIRNLGDDYMEGIRVSISGRGRRDFSVVGRTPSRMGPATTTSKVVRYRPRKAGRSSAVLTVRSSNAGTRRIIVRGNAKSRP